MPNYYPLGALSTSWKQYTLPFSYLDDGSCGSTSVSFHTSTIWGFEFQPYNSSSTGTIAFDIWIDDVTFYK